jgi:transketolase
MEDDIEIGKAQVLREGKDLTIAATGIMTTYAYEVAEKLAEEGIECTVLNYHTIKPFDEETLLKYVGQTGNLLTVEEHNIIGGLGGAVAECLSERCPTKLFRIGVRDVFGESGPAGELLHKYLLDGEGIYKQVKEFVKG